MAVCPERRSSTGARAYPPQVTLHRVLAYSPRVPGVCVEDVVAFDAGRMKELDMMVRRMGAIVSVFEVRSSTLGNKSFSAFREMMDVYIDMCSRELKSGKDFVENPPAPTTEDVERLNAAFERVFGRRPDQFTASG